MQNALGLAWPPTNCGPWTGQIYWLNSRGSVVKDEQMISVTMDTVKFKNMASMARA